MKRNPLSSASRVAVTRVCLVLLGLGLMGLVGCVTSGPKLSGMPAAGPPGMTYAETGEPR